MLPFCKREQPLVGVTYAPYVRDFVRKHPRAVDYVEISCEQLRHEPFLLNLRDEVPLVLHSSMLSIAGDEVPSRETIERVRAFAAATGTPWIGEHLAFTSATAHGWPEGAKRWEIGYTVSPVMTSATAVEIGRRYNILAAAFDVPLLLENTPIYFRMPGSELSQVDFIRELSTYADVALLLDLAHFHISATNVGFDPFTALDALPLERVVEVHISGCSAQCGLMWDDHGTMAPPIVLDLLGATLERAHPTAITLEYNWAPDLPDMQLLQEINRIRAVVINTRKGSP